MKPAGPSTLFVAAALLAGAAVLWMSAQRVDRDDSMQAASQVAAGPAVVAQGVAVAAEPADTPVERPPPLPAPRADSDRLLGRITDARGNGIAGIEVYLRALRNLDSVVVNWRAVTAADGSFTLADLHPDAIYLLFTRSPPGYPDYRLDGFRLGGLPKPFEIRLSRLDLVDLEGTIVNIEHAPIADFTVTIETLNTEYPARTVTSNASGHFYLRNFPAGPLKIYTGSSDTYRILGLDAPEDEYRSLTLVVDRGRYRLDGQVTDGSGKPIAAARVTLKSEITGRSYRSLAFRTRRTDADGYFEFAGLGAVPQDLGVYANGFKPYSLRLVLQSYSDHLKIGLQH